MRALLVCAALLVASAAGAGGFTVDEGVIGEMELRRAFESGSMIFGGSITPTDYTGDPGFQGHVDTRGLFELTYAYEPQFVHLDDLLSGRVPEVAGSRFGGCVVSGASVRYVHGLH